MRVIHAEDLLMEGGKRLGLQPIGGLGGLGRPIFSARVQRPGGQLGRNSPQVRANRILILGKVEMDLLERSTPERKKALFRELSLLDIPCIIVEESLPIRDYLRFFSQEQGIPLFGTHLFGPHLTRSFHRILEMLLGQGVHIQGVLMQVFDVGVLILGKSGIGKSECALDLISRGHALVADDLVELRRGGKGDIMGSSPELIRNHMEVRGLGIINILELFGDEAVALECPVELVVELLEWDRFRDMDRTGLFQMSFTILEKDVPLLRIPVSLNRNLAIILEVAVKNQLLRHKGIRPAERFARRIESNLRAKISS